MFSQSGGSVFTTFILTLLCIPFLQAMPYPQGYIAGDAPIDDSAVTNPASVAGFLVVATTTTTLTLTSTFIAAYESLSQLSSAALSSTELLGVTPTSINGIAILLSSSNSSASFSSTASALISTTTATSEPLSQPSSTILSSPEFHGIMPASINWNAILPSSMRSRVSISLLSSSATSNSISLSSSTMSAPGPSIVFVTSTPRAGTATQVILISSVGPAPTLPSITLTHWITASMK
ncbi:hypothetical protein EJ08DRAFT_235646 [Tothia fuscella]|uniref:Uncharacterized protein n=1 Tax=Tothia fuscella TaxID=1048955 RepID=A0A9P4NRU0_9PEZI|nr:hypothetical protein EJ08DRAFT_235646 [Tothia fuscella]